MFGDDNRHPLELSQDEHRKKQIELRDKQKRLRNKKVDLQERLEAKKEANFEARDAGNESKAEQLKRDAEDLKNELETVQTKLNTVDQMLTTVGNFLNVYELREVGEDQYWQRLRDMDRNELIKAFSEEKKDVKDLLDQIDTAATAGQGVIDDLSSQTDGLHRSSDLGWDEEYEASKNENTEGDVFSTDVGSTGSLNDDDLDDLQLS